MFVFTDENPVDAELTRKVDIGFPQLRPPRSQQTKERLAHVKAQRSNPELEKQARAQTRTYWVAEGLGNFGLFNFSLFINYC